MKTLAECRETIDMIDREIVRLFEARMAVCRDVAAYKIANGLPVLDASREQQVIKSRCELLNDAALADGTADLFACIMACSRKEQQKLLDAAGEAQG